MSDITLRATQGLTRLRNAVRDVAGSLLDDNPHTYVAAASSAIGEAIKLRQPSAPATDRVLAAGELDGMAAILSVLPRDGWAKFTVDAVKCARKLLTEIDPEGIAREERCVETLEEEAQLLCRLPASFTVATKRGEYHAQRWQGGRVLAVFRQDADGEPMFTMRGAVGDVEIEEAIRLYESGRTDGIREGVQNIRNSFQILMDVAGADHRHQA